MKPLLLATAACLFFSPATLHAQVLADALPKLPQLSQPPIGRHIELIVDDTGTGLATGILDLPVDPAGHTMIYFPEEIERATGRASRDFRVEVAQRRAAIYPVRRQLEPDARRAVTLASPSIAVNMMIRPANESEEAVAMVTVRRRSEKEARDAALAADRAQMRAENEQELADLRRQSEYDTNQGSKVGMLERFLAMRAAVQPTTVLGDVVPYAADAAEVTISNFQAVWSGNEMLLKFEVENTGATPFAWAESRAYGKDPRDNHAGAASVELPADPADGLVGRLPPGERAHAAILVERARDITGPITIVLGDKRGDHQVMAILHNWVPMQTHHTVQQMELRPVEPPDPERDKVSLHLQGVYGAVWLGDGAGLEKSDATSVTGLGVRAQYAFNRWLAFEGEVMGAGTGSAHFEGVTFEGEQGDLTRSARLGRAQFGGVLRFGQGTYVPLARLGVGLQGASHRGTLTTATGEAPGPDAFEFDALWHFGTGMDVRLGDSFVAGFTASGVAISGDLHAIEAGIHLGYGWKP